MMKKILFFALLALFIGCDKKETEVVTIKIGASPTPHALILENIKEDLKNEGISLEIVEFSDYVLPNLSLDDGSIDANFTQHQPYLDRMVADKKLKIQSIANIHIEPIGFYSSKIKDISELKNGAQIAIPNDPSNGGRALILMHHQGLIEIRDVNNLYSTELDIVSNPLNLKIKPLEAAMLPKVLADVDGAVINGNYALHANLSAKDALFLEDSRSPYANVLVVRASDMENPALLKLKNALLSQKTKDFLEEKFGGEIVPAF